MGWRVERGWFVNFQKVLDLRGSKGFLNVSKRSPVCEFSKSVRFECVRKVPILKVSDLNVSERYPI